MKGNKAVRLLLTLLAVASAVVMILTFSIGVPIYFRPFYYMQIDSLGVEEDTEKTREQIIEGYDEVLDYLTRPGGSFSSGDFAFSESGASHFKDCKDLFTLNAFAFIIASVVLLAVLYLDMRRGFKLLRPFGLSPCALSGGAVLCGISFIGVFASVNFRAAFRVFHRVLFPGNYDWLFDPELDEIILALPAEFFASCAALIGVTAILISVIFIIFGSSRGRELIRRAVGK